MKEALIYAGGAYVVIQTLVLMAVMAAAARPTPEFPRQSHLRKERKRVGKHEEQFELVC